jgi:hypothetical protein
LDGRQRLGKALRGASIHHAVGHASGGQGRADGLVGRLLALLKRLQPAQQNQVVAGRVAGKGGSVTSTLALRPASFRARPNADASWCFPVEGAPVTAIFSTMGESAKLRARTAYLVT